MQLSKNFRVWIPILFFNLYENCLSTTTIRMSSWKMLTSAYSRYAIPTVNFCWFLLCYCYSKLFCWFSLCYSFGKLFSDSCYAIPTVSFFWFFLCYSYGKLCRGKIFSYVETQNFSYRNLHARFHFEIFRKRFLFDPS